MFAHDRDLLTLEPNLFRDVAWAGQRLVTDNATLTDGTLRLSTPSAADVTPGNVAVVGTTPLEVIERTDAQHLVVSILRDAPDHNPRIPTDAPEHPVSVITFSPQIRVIHEQLLDMLSEACAMDLVPEQITRPGGLWRIEAFGALALIYSAVAALQGQDSPVAQRAAHHEEQARLQRRTVAVGVDTDRDGITDRTVRLHQMHLIRA